MLKPWGERKFELGFPEWMAPFFIERFSGTPARLADKLSNVEKQINIRPSDDKWSIQEHAGHLLKAEELWWKRFTEFADGASDLTAADMTGKRVWEADFNSMELSVILDEFRKSREKLVKFLFDKEYEYFSYSAFHPRLKTDMTPVDLIYFACEHDDYHLAVITDMLK
jgi:uncharacterized damage-inducible protein DinB